MALQKMEANILRSILEHNILPVTSHCDCRCVFCSHRQNPPGVEALFFGKRDYNVIISGLEYLDKNKKIVIGESATKLIEGEPFLHPRLLEIIETVRNKFPTTKILLTTNGNFLDENKVSFLKRMEPLEINLSVNAINHVRRKKLMGNCAKDMLPVLKVLQQKQLVFHGSMVAMPWVTGWNEITETIEALEESNAATIRVFLPGYTRLAPDEMKFPPEFWEELNTFIAGMQKKVSIPICLEPPLVNNLSPEVIGVIRQSPAEAAGVKPGDIILKVNDFPVFSRVEAFNLIKEASTLSLKVERQGEIKEINISKKAGSASGIVMDYDIDPITVEGILDNIKRFHPKGVLLMVSPLGYKILKLALEKYIPEGIKVYYYPVKSRFFGGSIMAAGLLTVEDFIQAWREWKKDHGGEKIDLVILPGRAFDTFGKDLTGAPYWKLADEANCTVVAI